MAQKHLNKIESPVLQSVARTGNKKFWQAVVYCEGNSYFYKKIWWQESKEGKKSKVQESTPVEVFGKNIGRANETSAAEQAKSEFDSIVQKQRDKGYSESGSAEHIPTKPMLANKYETKKHTVEFPCFAQPKLDGFRMLKEADGTKAWTRGGKPHVPECVAHLMWDTQGNMIDGELMLPHMPPLQETSRAAKKFRPDVSPTLKYYVYDVVESELPFHLRYELLQELVKTAPENVELVETVLVNNEQELFEAHARFTARGFEGTIVRAGDGGYEIGHRSTSLLKMKDFQDAEFKISRLVSGKGSFQNKAIFICESSNGKEFNVVTNIRRADVSENKGWVVLELEGTEENIEQGIAWVISKGVRFDPVIGDIIEG